MMRCIFLYLSIWKENLQILKPRAHFAFCNEVQFFIYLCFHMLSISEVFFFFPCNSSGLTLERILRSSSRYKKAKLTVSQSQLEDTENEPVDFVPDSQANPWSPYCLVLSVFLLDFLLFSRTWPAGTSILFWIFSRFLFFFGKKARHLAMQSFWSCFLPYGHGSTSKEKIEV